MHCKHFGQEHLHSTDHIFFWSFQSTVYWRDKAGTSFENQQRHKKLQMPLHFGICLTQTSLCYKNASKKTRLCSHL